MRCASAVTMIVVMVLLTTTGSSESAPRPGKPGASILVVSSTIALGDHGLIDSLMARYRRATGFGTARGTKPQADVNFTDEIQISEGGIWMNPWVIAGPVSNPASIKARGDAAEVFLAIFRAGSVFVSSGDGSLTYRAEQARWPNGGLSPRGHKWYRRSGAGASAALKLSERLNAYTFCDRASYVELAGRGPLRLLWHGAAANPVGFREHGDYTYRLRTPALLAFHKFIVAPETKRFVKHYGETRYGQPLFQVR